LEEIDWPWFAARAFALAGDSARALALYRRIGARADIRSLEADDVTANALPGVLSPREREVAELVALAKSNKEIARTLKISLKTVEKHVSAALVKLHFTSRAQLARFLTEKK
jgi:DNA-binding NarL/FixJ family response regulator